MKRKVLDLFIIEGITIINKIGSRKLRNLKAFLTNFKANSTKKNAHEEFEKLLHDANNVISPFFIKNKNLYEKWHQITFRVYGYLKNKHNQQILRENPKKSSGFLFKPYQRYDVKLEVNKHKVLIKAVANFHSRRMKLHGKTIAKVLSDGVYEVALDEEVKVDWLKYELLTTEELEKEYISEQRDWVSYGELEKNEIDHNPDLDKLMDHFSSDLEDEVILITRMLVSDKSETEIDQMILSILTNHFVSILKNNPSYISKNLQINLSFGKHEKFSGSYYKRSTNLIELFIEINESAIGLVVDYLLGIGRSHMKINRVIHHELGHLAHLLLKDREEEYFDKIGEAIRNEGVAEAIAILNAQKHLTWDENFRFKIEEWEFEINHENIWLYLSDYCDKDNNVKFEKALLKKKPFDYFYYDKGLLHSIGYEVMLIIMLYKYEKNITFIEGDQNLDDYPEYGGQRFFDYFKIVNARSIVANRYNDKFSIHFNRKYIEGFLRKLKLYKVRRYLKEYEKACKHFGIKPIVPFDRIFDGFASGETIRQIFTKKD